MLLAENNVLATIGYPTANSAKVGDVALGIDFVGVAESHVLFFGRVKDYIQGEPHEVNAGIPDFDESCELDSWLKGCGASRFGKLTSFVRLRDAHAEFHRHASEVLAKIHAGSWVAAENMRRNELSQGLRRVLITLTELNESIDRQLQAVN